MTTLAILGGKGMLGSDLSILAEKGGFRVLSFDLPETDITVKTNIENAVSSADIVVNCAAYTAVDRAETERDKCRNINALAVGMLGEIVRKRNKHLIHISTDFVFGDNSTKPLSENDVPAPFNYYGESKIEGEKLLAVSGCKNCILRIGWTYGRNGNNFATKILRSAMEKNALIVVDDQFGSPTWTQDVSRAILCLTSRGETGIYHFTSRGYASRYETAKFILAEFGIKTPVRPCKTSDFPLPALRPCNSRLDCSRIDKILDFERPEWKISLRNFLKSIKPDFFSDPRQYL